MRPLDGPQALGGERGIEMTQQFPLLFTPFQLGKYTLQSRIVVTGHAANFYDRQKHPQRGLRLLSSGTG